MRGDVRYFRALVDESAREGVLLRDYDFLRVSVGVTVQFPRSCTTDLYTASFGDALGRLDGVATMEVRRMTTASAATRRECMR